MRSRSSTPSATVHSCFYELSHGDGLAKEEWEPVLKPRTHLFQDVVLTMLLRQLVLVAEHTITAPLSSPVASGTSTSMVVWILASPSLSRVSLELPCHSSFFPPSVANPVLVRGLRWFPLSREMYQSTVSLTTPTL